VERVNKKSFVRGSPKGVYMGTKKTRRGGLAKNVFLNHPWSSKPSLKEGVLNWGGVQLQRSSLLSWGGKNLGSYGKLCCRKDNWVSRRAAWGDVPGHKLHLFICASGGNMSNFGDWYVGQEGQYHGPDGKSGSGKGGLGLVAFFRVYCFSWGEVSKGGDVCQRLRRFFLKGGKTTTEN